MLWQRERELNIQVLAEDQRPSWPHDRKKVARPSRRAREQTRQCTTERSIGQDEQAYAPEGGEALRVPHGPPAAAAPQQPPTATAPGGPAELEDGERGLVQLHCPRVLDKLLKYLGELTFTQK